MLRRNVRDKPQTARQPAAHYLIYLLFCFEFEFNYKNGENLSAVQLDRTNIILLAITGIFIILSSVFSLSKGVVISVVLAALFIAFIRFVYLTSGRKTATILSMVILIIPVVIYLTGIILPFAIYYFWDLGLNSN